MLRDADDGPFLTASELRRKMELNVSDNTLALWRRRGLPFYGGRSGGVIRPLYVEREVRQWLKSLRSRRRAKESAS